MYYLIKIEWIKCHVSLFCFKEPHLQIEFSQADFICPISNPFLDYFFSFFQTFKTLFWSCNCWHRLLCFLPAFRELLSHRLNHTIQRMQIICKSLSDFISSFFPLNIYLIINEFIILFSSVSWLFFPSSILLAVLKIANSFLQIYIKIGREYRLYLFTLPCRSKTKA